MFQNASSHSCFSQGLIYNALNFAEEIEWPDEEEWQGGSDARDLIQQLLTHDPLERLGTAGAQEVKEHPFFDGLNWESMLRQKAEFVPQLDNEEDTSYFDSEFGTRMQNATQYHREQEAQTGIQYDLMRFSTGT